MNSIMLMTFMFILISLILYIMNLLISNKINNREKSSPFECGFDPMSSARLPFSIQFYTISIIFLIFDVEIIIFLPMISSFLSNNLTYWSETSLYFIMILMIGIYIEWFDGALKWLK